MRRVFALLLATAGTVVLASGLALEADAPGDHPPAPAHLARQAGPPAAVEPASRPGGRDAGLVRDLRWRNIGPANMAGRVADIEALESNPAIVLVASASGGVFKSVNAGTTWEPIFDDYGAASIGDIAIFQKDPNIIWVGTGESCVRNSVAWGDGVYKSTDGGKSFVNVGLGDTHHISEVVTHPVDPNIAYVAAQGHLWGHRGERGLFKTIDGGKSWQRLAGGLPDDGRTGASDLKMDPKNPNVLYAGFWERLRRPYRFDSGGPNGGIFKSVDAGRTWKKLTSGLPSGPVGKVGLSIFRRNPNVLVAIVEHGFQPARGSAEYNDLTKLGTGIYRSEDAGKNWTLVNRYNERPFYYSHIYLDPVDDRTMYVFGASAHVSEDGGKTFSRTLDGIAGDFHALWIDPSNRDRFYVGNDKGAYLTHDRGLRFVMFDNMAIGQFYAVTLDNRDPYWVYGGLQDNGNWGGPSNSRDYNGILNDHWFKFHSGDGFHATVDPSDWRTVYTESQGGNIRRLDAVFRQTGKSITPTPRTVLNFRQLFPDFKGPDSRLPQPQFRFNWSSPIILSPHDPNTVYLGGNYLFRSTDRGDTWTIVSPDLSTNDPVKTDPESGGLTRDVTSAETHCTLITIVESPVARGLIWAGTDDGNVQVTRDGGGSWSNVRPNITGVPAGLWVSRVTPSRFAEGSAYVTFDGHRSDDFRPYIVKTTDFGKTWTSLASDLPATGPVYVITEDLRAPGLLFVGTESGAWFTVDSGRHWERLMNGLPTVAVHDLVIHPRDNDLVAATHGRSVWILDDITPLQQLTSEVRNAEAHVFQNRVATVWKAVSRGGERGHLLFMGRNPLTIGAPLPANSPSELQNSAAVHFYLKAKPAAPVTIEIGELAGPRTFTAKIAAEAGINRFYWPLRFDPPSPSTATAASAGRAAGGAGAAAGGAGASGGAAAAAGGRGAEAGGRGGEAGGRGAQAGGRGGVPGATPAGAGTYLVRLTVGGTTYTSTVTVRDDPGMK